MIIWMCREKNPHYKAQDWSELEGCVHTEWPYRRSGFNCEYLLIMRFWINWFAEISLRNELICRTLITWRCHVDDERPAVRWQDESLFSVMDLTCQRLAERNYHRTCYEKWIKQWQQLCSKKRREHEASCEPMPILVLSLASHTLILRLRGVARPHASNTFIRFAK